MAKTPIKKRRRAASPPPRKKVRAPRPTRKGTSPYQSSKAFAARAGRIALLLHPLTSDQEKDIRESFGTRPGAEQLLRHWTHISKEAYRWTLAEYLQAERARVLLGSRAGQQRHARLKKATAAAARATKAVKDMVANWRSELGTDAIVKLALWSDAVTSRLAQEREAIKRYRAQAHTWSSLPGKSGPPEEPETYRLKVLAAYFRHHGLEVSAYTNSLFAQVAEAVLGRATTATTGKPMYRPRLKAFVASRYVYTPPSSRDDSEPLHEY